jgi:hypothetical protein
LYFKYYFGFLRAGVKCLADPLKSRHIFGDCGGSLAKSDAGPGELTSCGKPRGTKLARLRADGSLVIALGTYSHNLW